MGLFVASALATTPPVPPPADDRDALAQLWTGIYDMTEERVASNPPDSPLEPQATRLQINVRRVTIPWLGTHVLYVEEFPFDQPFEARRRVLLSIEPAANAEGTLRVRQFTRRTGGDPGSWDADDIESMTGCDIFLKREGTQFRGGTRGRKCLETEGGEQRWLDYRVVIGDGLFWYRRRRLDIPGDDLTEEIAGFPHVDLDEARLFSCGISWAAKDKGPRKPIETFDLHDRGGRAHFRTPDGRALTLELHGSDWPLSQGRESLVLILTDGKADSEPIASSWTSLHAARVGIDIGWLAIDCAPVVSDTGEQRS
jgi:hypothetical protein